MKILCDFCKREEASVFCSSDDAALCGPCDRRIHSANKVARRHSRQPLLQPSSAAASCLQASPLCDICHEKRGYVFCQEDRAVLCRECDGPIHAANHLTAKHNRFLLTGARIAAGHTPPAANEATASTVDVSSYSSRNHHRQEVVAVDDEIGRSCSSNTTTAAASSFSDYLLQTLPGWQVDDFLMDDGTSMAATAVHGLYQASSDGVPLVEPVMENSSAQEFTAWGHQYPSSELWGWNRQF